MADLDFTHNSIYPVVPADSFAGLVVQLTGELHRLDVETSDQVEQARVELLYRFLRGAFVAVRSSKPLARSADLRRARELQTDQRQADVAALRPEAVIHPVQRTALEQVWFAQVGST